MLRLAIIAAFLSCAACVPHPTQDTPISPTLSGFWVGEIQWSASFPADGGRTSGSKEIVFMNCGGEPEFYWKEGDDYLKSTAKYDYVRNRTTHVLSFVTQEQGDDPRWIETHLAEPDDPERAFAQVGFGLLRKTSGDCDDLD